MESPVPIIVVFHLLLLFLTLVCQMKWFYLGLCHLNRLRPLFGLLVSGFWYRVGIKYKFLLFWLAFLIDLIDDR